MMNSVVMVSAEKHEAEIESKLDELLPKGVVHEKTSEGLPTANLKKEILPQIIRTFLLLVGSINMVVFVYAGIMLIIAQGNEEEITKFKNIIIWSLVGLAFVMAAYAIVTGVMQLVFK